MTGPLLIVVFLLSMVYLFVTIVRFKMNPFFSMISAAIIIGVVVGMDLNALVGGITSGFGGVCSSLGIVVAMGFLLGGMLSEAGATDSLADAALSTFGEKRASLAMNLTGFIVSIPVFYGSAYVILNPILRTLSRKTRKPIQVYITALSVGLLTTHCLVIPTPGPLSVAGTIGVNFGWFILYSLLVSIPGALVGGWLYGEFLGKKRYTYVEPVAAAGEAPEAPKAPDKKRAPAGLASAIIALPLLLIVFGTLIPMWVSVPGVVSLCQFFTAGNGVIALIASVIFAAWTLRPYVQGSYAPIITKNFNEMGEIMLLLGAGGSFGAIIQASGIGDYFVALLRSWNVPLIVLAFLLCLLMRTALGSAAVAMVTTASIVAPLCAQLGESGIIMGLSICAASMAFATPTDAAFWLVQKLDNLSFKDTWITHTFGNAIACGVMFAIVLLLNAGRGFLPGL